MKQQVLFSNVNSGKYQAVLPKRGYIYISHDYGETWTSSTISSNSWVEVGVSNVGKFMIAGTYEEGIYISDDYGSTWRNYFIGKVQGVAISGEGQYQAVCSYNNYIYESDDYGASWTSVGTSKNWSGIKISTDGQRQTAIVNGDNIYISDDYGSTWNSKGPSLNWKEISMSGNGKYQLAITYDLDYPYKSSDYGNTWNSFLFNTYEWDSCDISIHGNIQIMITDGYKYTSLDYNQTRVQENFISNCNLFKITSPDGYNQTYLVESTSEYIYKTTDFGDNWYTVGNANGWYSIDSSMLP